MYQQWLIYNIIIGTIKIYIYIQVNFSITCYCVYIYIYRSLNYANIPFNSCKYLSCMLETKNGQDSNVRYLLLSDNNTYHVVFIDRPIRSKHVYTSSNTYVRGHLIKSTNQISTEKKKKKKRKIALIIINGFLHTHTYIYINNTFFKKINLFIGN